MPTENSTERTVAELLRNALLEIRYLSRKLGDSRIEQLADVFHNIPTALVEGRLDTSTLKAELRALGNEGLYPFASRADDLE